MMQNQHVLKTLLAMVMLGSIGSALGEDRYVLARIAQLEFTGGETAAESGAQPNWRHLRQMSPCVLLEGGGEAYVQGQERWNPSHDGVGSIAAKVSRIGPLTGTIVLRQNGTNGPSRRNFRAPESTEIAEAKRAFYAAKAAYYQGLWDQEIPGGAWFELQAAEARKLNQDTNIPGQPAGGSMGGNGQIAREYELFTGGRAISENLQLDRPLASPAAGSNTVTLGNLQGIGVAAIDWKPLIAGLQPETDVLASYIPADQHAVLFPSFASLIQVLDQADAYGSLILGLSETRNEDAQLGHGYQQQLCLPTSELARQLGPLLIQSVALTGGDPYLKTGSDVTVLFECRQPTILLAYLKTKHAEAKKIDAACQDFAGDAEGLAFTGVANARRTVSSYVANSGNVVCVSNSKLGIQTFAGTVAGKIFILVNSDEYTFFRSRYPKGKDTGFIILTDATIRRWCGPRWRIGCARRTQAAAQMYRHQAKDIQSGQLPTDESIEPYGNLDFLTPIGELDMAEVSPAEASAYNAWKNQYQRNWRGMFDPIAIQLTLTNHQLSIDTSVIPMIAGTDYRSWIERTKDAAIAPATGYPHREAILQLATAINAKSEEMDGLGRMVNGNRPGKTGHPLDWMGQTMSLFVDDDPVWAELFQKTNLMNEIDREIHRLPLGLSVEVANPLATTVFLTGLRAMADDAAPALMHWETQEYQGTKYMKIAPNRRTAPENPRGMMGDLEFYYWVTPDRLLLSINENIIKRAIEKKGHAEESRAWLGKSLCFQVTARGVEVINLVFQDELQCESYNNLPILNEWHRLFPDQDPVDVHYRYSHTRLVCPGGGKYVWNESWGTMESTQCGHPYAAKRPAASRWDMIRDGNFGVSFENNQLRAKVVLTQK